MAEDVGLCTYVRHHQQKIVLFLAAMREYADLLRRNDFVVDYHGFEQDAESVFEEKLADFVAHYNLRELVHFEIEDRFFAERIARFCVDNDIAERVVESPMFLTPRSQFAAYLESAKRPFMADFYKRQRRELGILTDEELLGGWQPGDAAIPLTPGWRGFAGPITPNLIDFEEWDYLFDLQQPPGVIPEPSTFTVFALGVLGLGLVGLRRRKRA